MPNFLNLKKKDPSDIVYVEKIVLKKRSLSFELFRMLTIIAVASGIVWGISNADNLVNSVETKSVAKNFSAIGVVSNIATSTLSIEDAKGSNDKNQNSYTFNTDTVIKIETKSYVQLLLSDIKVGDRIIVQGVENNKDISIRRIISLSEIKPNEKTATSTDETALATTTSTSTATTTDISIATSTSTSSPSLIETIKDAVSNAIDVITGTTTSTSTEEDTTSTSTATSTDESITSISTPKNTSVIQTITDAVKDATAKVVQTITGSSSSAESTDTPAVPVVEQKTTGETSSSQTSDTSGSNSPSTDQAPPAVTQ